MPVESRGGFRKRSGSCPAAFDGYANSSLHCIPNVVICVYPPEMSGKFAGGDYYKYYKEEENPTMSEEKNSISGATGLVDTLKSNPKAKYAAIGAAVLVALYLTMGGRSGDEGVTQIKSAAVSVGQTVTIQNPNVGNTILVPVPGRLGSADNEEDDTIVCRHVVAGTSATVEEENTVNYITFVKVTLKDGECAGKTGWLPKVNIKQ